MSRPLRHLAWPLLLLLAALPALAQDRGNLPPPSATPGTTARPGSDATPEPPSSGPLGQPTNPPRGAQTMPGDVNAPERTNQRAQGAETPDQRARSYYPPRPPTAQPEPELDALLTEMEAEAQTQLPLYGQRIFRQAVIDRVLAGQERDRPVATPPPSYRLLPGDRMTISFWNPYVEPQHADIEVHSDGTVGFDPVGVVQVSGMTTREFESLMTRLIRLKGPREATVRVSYTGLHSVRVSVRGEVRRITAAADLRGYATVFDALAAAGGPDAFASLRHIRVYRGETPIETDLYRYLLYGDPSCNLTLRDGDGVYVPVANTLVSVDGEVARPARYELSGEQTARQVLELAGGLRSRAARVQVARLRQHESEERYDFSVAEILADGPAVRAIEPIQPGDLIHAVEAGAARDVVTVRGAVGSPGDYGVQPGMTLGQLVTKAQGVLRAGHAAVGTIRRPQPSGEVRSLNFEVADLQTNGPSASLPIQAGDIVEIPLLSERAPMTVVISGAVNKPGTYQMRTANTLADLIQAAQGLAPGAAPFARVQSTATGTAVETRSDLTALARGGEPTPNPTLANGDTVIIPFLREIGAARQVRIEGFVRSPGTYTLTEDMRLADLLQRAGGLLPRAATRGQIVRVVPGTNETRVQYVDFAKALAGDATENVALQEDDLVQVENAAAILAPVEPAVTITGPVGRPGRYTRSVGMHVSDLILQGGGLRLEADRDTATLLRLTEHGQVRRIPVNPARAMAGDEEANLALQDGDVLEVTPWQDVSVHRAVVRAAGAVYRPGTFDLTEGMTLDDLLFLAGGPTPDAYLPRAELERRDQNGRTRVVPFDLSIKPLRVPLQDGDLLRVYTHEQAIYREPTVEIMGEVQHPGRYERTVGMTLLDLIFRAGGLTRNPAFTAIEVARARSTSVIPLMPDIQKLLALDPAQNFELQDGDAIYIRTVGEYQERPREVLIRGRVKLPGFYPLTGQDDSLRTLIQERAHGLLDGAFTEGTVLLRRVDEVVDPEVARYGTDIFKALQVKRQRDDYALVLTRGVTGDPSWIQRAQTVLPTEGVTSEIAKQLGEPMDLSNAEREVDNLTRERFAGGSGAGGVAQGTEVLRHYVRVSLDLDTILSGKTDLRLRPNDILVIPETPSLILVQGEVASNMAQPFVENQPVSYYLRQAGGVTRDADARGILVIRANGSLSSAENNTVIRRGDMIVVPPKPLSLPREHRAMEDVQAIASVLGGVATTMLAITQAFR